MTPKQIEQERAAFEAWYCEYHQIPEPHRAMFTNRSSPCEEKYEGTAGHTAWQAWRARAEQTGWISVEDKLPEADAIVLAVVRNNPEVGLFSLVDFGDDGLRWSIVTIEGVCPVDDLRITHWQPLPQPPEGEKE